MEAVVGIQPHGCIWMCPPPWLIPSLYRYSGGRFREPTKLGAEYAHRAFTNVVPFDEAEPKEVRTAVRYGRGLAVPMAAIPADAFVFCSSCLHTNSDLGVPWLVGLLWTRATTQWH
jgi:hypothetical protein